MSAKTTLENFNTLIPQYFNIILGEGNHEGDESDWNSVALWRFKKKLKPGIKASEYFFGRAQTVNVLKKKFIKAKGELEKYGKQFLENDLTIFYKIRNSTNKNRTPCKVYTPNINGGYDAKYDKTSISLKNKFSK